MHLAGPRDRIFFRPDSLRCGIVTCGGLCPGINNVIRGLVLELTHAYGVKEIYGFRYGFEGLVARHGHAPMRLGPAEVSEVHQKGGTLLGTSRGGQDPREMVDTLVALGIGALFVRRRNPRVRLAPMIDGGGHERGARDDATEGIPDGHQAASARAPGTRR